MWPISLNENSPWSTDAAPPKAKGLPAWLEGAELDSEARVAVVTPLGAVHSGMSAFSAHSVGPWALVTWGPLLRGLHPQPRVPACSNSDL